MSATKRLISGSAASWARIGITMVSQIALVPLFLSNWNKETYGVWIAIQALIVIFTLPDSGHQDFLGFEFLKLGKDKKTEISLHLWSGVRIALLIGAVEILLIIAFWLSNSLGFLLGDRIGLSATLVRDAGIVLLLQGVGWFFSKTVILVFARSLETFGYYPRMAWWSVLLAAVTSIVPAVVVYFKGSLVMTGIITCIVTIILAILQYADILKLMKKIGFEFYLFSWNVGAKNLMRSMALSGRYLLENARQQGVRLVLSPLVGASGLAAFSTMRTGANVAMQGLGTITYPLMPELMRFLNQKDQERSEIAFGTVWIVVVCIMSPAILALQAFVEPLYVIWTRGKISFDPTLFALLSLGILIFAVEQPAMAVLKGNNLLKQQLTVASFSAGSVLIGMLFLVPVCGILGAGIALLIAEIIATTGYRIFSRRWMKANGLFWPRRPYFIANISILITALAMALMLVFPEKKILILILGLLLLLINAWMYWRCLPKLAHDRFRSIVGKFVPARLLRVLQ